jgi:hypothetical protein
MTLRNTTKSAMLCMIPKPDYWIQALFHMLANVTFFVALQHLFHL